MEVLKLLGVFKKHGGMFKQHVGLCKQLLKKWTYFISILHLGQFIEFKS